MFKKTFALLFTLLLAVQPAIAIVPDTDEEDHIDEASFEHISSGEEALEDGYFINPAGMAKILSDKELLLKKKDIDCKLQTDKLQIDIDKLTREYEGKLEIKERMYTNLLELKDTKIKYLEDNRNSEMWKVVGIFAVGFAASYSMFVLATNTVK
jgi:hypothetical protein